MSLSALARKASHAGILKKEKLDARVISVGNLQVGGAGKTPLVAQIAREAAERGLQTCILTRGYKSKWETAGGVLAPGQSGVSAEDCGDEPALLHDLCPLAYIVVGAERTKQYEKVKREHALQFDLVILDDGLQHWKIHRDLDVVALTSACPGRVLFRDSVHALKDQDLLVWTKGIEKPDTAGRPYVRIKYQIDSPKNNRPLWLITGVADGNSVYDLVQRAGYAIEKHIQLPDHFQYSRESVQSFYTQAQKVDCGVALTGKDWVKWRDLGVAQSDVVILEPKLVFAEGRELWLQKLWGG
jgi:tetraacyldisaccharide 4'-kinase